MNIFEIALDVDKRANKESVNLRQGDIYGTTIRATLSDHGTPMEGGSYDGFFCMTLPDRKTYYRTEATYDSGVVTVVVDERIAAAVPGATNNAYFELYDGDELKYTTASFIVRVKASAMSGKAADSYDSRIEAIMEELREALEVCVPPEVTVDDSVDGQHTITITCPTTEGAFTVIDGVDGKDGEKGEKGEKGDTGDPVEEGSIGFEQLDDSVNARLNSSRLYGVLTDESPSTDDAYPAPLVSGVFYGESTQSGIPSMGSPAIIASIDEVTVSTGAHSVTIDLQGYELCGYDNIADELVIDENGGMSIVKKVLSYDLGTLEYAKTETKTGGLSRYYSTDLSASIVPAVDNNTTAQIMCDTFVPVTYTDVYNRVKPECIGVSSAGTVSIYSEEHAGSTHSVQEFTEDVSGATLLCVASHPETIELGNAELPLVDAPVLTVSCNVPFSVKYERDIGIVVSKLLGV